MKEKERFPAITLAPPSSNETERYLEEGFQPLLIDQQKARSSLAAIEDIGRRRREAISRWEINFSDIHISSKYYNDARAHFLNFVNRSDPEVLRNVDAYRSRPAPRPEGLLLAICGNSKSGKTHMLKRFRLHTGLIAEHTPNGDTRPCVMVTAPSDSRHKSLLETLLAEVTSEHRDKLKKDPRPAHKISLELKTILRNARTRILIIDEAHNIEVADANDRDKCLLEIKNLMTDTQWPISIVLAGKNDKTQRLIGILADVKTRSRIVVIKQLQAGDPQLPEYIAAIEAQIGFPEPSKLSEGDMPDRFLLASEGYRGSISDLIRSAGLRAFHLPKISREHLAESFRDMHGAEKVNPFRGSQ